ncbi:MAG: phosphate/phosphite/phosphonate ABC transporter substrate-binding protein [Polyangiaceae bacterium]
MKRPPTSPGELPALRSPSSGRTLVSGLTFGLVPVVDSDHARIDIADFCGFLEREIAMVVRPHRAPTPEALASAFGAGRVHLAWVSPTLLVSADSLADAVPLACTLREGASFYHSVLFTLESSRFTSLETLRGARAAWASPTSAGGYVFPKLSLESQGIDGATFATEVFCGTHGNVASAVLEGRADVGATFAVFEDGDPTKRAVSTGYDEAARSAGASMRILDVAGPIPSDLFVAQSSMPATLRARIMRAFERIARDPAARDLTKRLFGADGFTPYSPEARDRLRAFVTAAHRGKAPSLF